MKEKTEGQAVTETKKTSESHIEDGIIDDITKEDLREIVELKNATNKEEFLKYKRKTPARLGISRAGSRYTTHTMLRLRADHAAAQDAVLSSVNEDFLKANNLFIVKSRCEDKDQYITRPDLGEDLMKNQLRL